MTKLNFAMGAYALAPHSVLAGSAAHKVIGAHIFPKIRWGTKKLHRSIVSTASFLALHKLHTESTEAKLVQACGARK
ncbi:hypothetical protein [Leisingera sp.]|uniref:hypothetical protein n=1 Tax=Leisingera sp. TaxID=1879318 RepID=UPI002B278EBA|nr:hypothetical protein [Leisingera sp.]